MLKDSSTKGENLQMDKSKEKDSTRLLKDSSSKVT